MNMISKIMGEWTNIEEFWSPVTVRQEKAEGEWILDGSDYQEKLKLFECHKNVSTNEVYPLKSRYVAVGLNLAYASFFVPHKIATCAGRALIGATSMAYYSFCSGDEDNAETYYNSGWEKLSRCGVEALALGGAYAAYYYVPVDLQGYGNMYTYTAAAALAIAACALKPLSFQVVVNKLESWVNVPSLNDGQVSDLTWPGTITSVLDGSYSLSRIFKMYCLGVVDGSTIEEVASEDSGKIKKEQ